MIGAHLPSLMELHQQRCISRVHLHHHGPPWTTMVHLSSLHPPFGHQGGDTPSAARQSGSWITSFLRLEDLFADCPPSPHTHSHSPLMVSHLSSQESQCTLSWAIYFKIWFYSYFLVYYDALKPVFSPNQVVRSRACLLGQCSFTQGWPLDNATAEEKKPPLPVCCAQTLFHFPSLSVCHSIYYFPNNLHYLHHFF